jgi:hypothetical protein
MVAIAGGDGDGEMQSRWKSADFFWGVGDGFEIQSVAGPLLGGVGGTK